GAEVTEQARLDVLGPQRLAQQRVGAQIDLPDRQIVGRAPPGVDGGVFLAAEWAGGVGEFVGTRRDGLAGLGGRAWPLRHVDFSSRALLLAGHPAGRPVGPNTAGGWTAHASASLRIAAASGAAASAGVPRGQAVSARAHRWSRVRRMQNLARIIGIGTVAAAAFALTACGSDDSDTAASATSTTTAARATTSAAPQTFGRECTAADVQVTGGFGENPTITLPDDCDAQTQLIVEDLVPGSGPSAQPGQELTMNCSLVGWSGGEKLDSSFDRGEPFQLILGAGMVIPGWEQWLEGVQQGARRLLLIP